jgi:biotin carboxyl carrier protein
VSGPAHRSGAEIVDLVRDLAADARGVDALSLEEPGLSLWLSRAPAPAPVATAVATPQPVTEISAPSIGEFCGVVAVGDRVEAGGRIGSLRLRSEEIEVTAPTPGRVSEVVRSGQMVEYGSKLAVVDVGGTLNPVRASERSGE